MNIFLDDINLLKEMSRSLDLGKNEIENHSGKSWGMWV